MRGVDNQQKLGAGGHVRTVLVAGTGPGAVAVLSDVIARANTGSGRRRLTFNGDASFTVSGRRHITRVVLPVVEELLRGLGLRRRCFELEVANIAAAAAREQTLEISGFSADAPVFLALLSAALNIGVPRAMVATGHVASRRGEIRAVRNLDVKLRAAADCGKVLDFVCPSLEGDASLSRLFPGTKDAYDAALCRAKASLVITTVTDVGDFVRHAFSDLQVVHGALTSGVFGRDVPDNAQDSPVGRSLLHLTRDLEDRFLVALEECLLGGAPGIAEKLLLARLRLQARRREYPSGLGVQAVALLRSLPPGLAPKAPFRTPVLTRLASKLAAYAADSDMDDFRLLLEAITWDCGERGVFRSSGTQQVVSPSGDRGVHLLNELTEAISKQRLAEDVGLPLDSARASYVLPSATVESSDEFHHVIAAYYLHILRRTGSLLRPCAIDNAGPAALDLITEAFGGHGGIAGALAEGMSGVKGGMRWVLDRMTDEAKRQATEKRILHAFTSMVDPLGYEAKVEVVAALLRRCTGGLPADIAGEPPERFAKYCEVLAKTYAESLDQVRDVLRTM